MRLAVRLRSCNAGNPESFEMSEIWLYSKPRTLNEGNPRNETSVISP